MGRVTREAVYDRQSGYCWWCGLPLGDNWALHHRKLRKHGGPDTLGNLLALHHRCHNLGTGSVHLAPADAYERGFLVHSWDDPHKTPLRRHGGAYLLLDDTGSITPMEGNTHGWEQQHHRPRQPGARP